MSTPSTPLDDVTFRPPHAPSPTFSGMTPNLPSPLRELRRRKSKPIPSEMTALANRLGGIRLDHSPEYSEPTAEGKGIAPHVYPLKLEFSERNPSSEKENIRTPAANTLHRLDQPFPDSPAVPHVPEHPTDERKSRVSGKGISLCNPTDNSHFNDDHDDVSTEKLHDDIASTSSTVAAAEPAVACGASPALSAVDGDPASKTHTSNSPVDSTAAISNHDVVHAPDFRDNKHEKNNPATSRNQGAGCGDVEEDAQIPSAKRVMARESVEEAHPNLKIATSTNQYDNSQSEVQAELHSAMNEPGVGLNVDKDIHLSSSSTELRPKDDGIVCGDSDREHVSISRLSPLKLRSFEEAIEKVIEGDTKWKWPHRCEALKLMTTTVRAHFNDQVSRTVGARLPTLAAKINDHLGELRPSVVSAALLFVDAILSSPLSNEDFAKDVLSKVTEIASGISLHAENAAQSLSLALDTFPSLHGVLADLDNPHRLCEVLEKYCQKEGTSESCVSKAKRVQEAVGKMHVTVLQPSVLQAISDSDTVPTLGGGNNNPSPADQNLVPNVASQLSLLDGGDGPIAGSGDVLPLDRSLSEHRGEGSQNSANRIRSLRFSRMSWRAKLETPSLVGKQGILNDVFEGENSHPDGISNWPAQTRGSNPLSPWNGRVYSKEEVEEIRQTAIETVIEKLGHAHNEKLEEVTQQKLGLEHQVQKERSEIKELQSVLEEFELTMSKMVSEGNSHANAQHLASQKEKTKLKAELADVSDAFEKLKEKYDMAKQAIELMETKENRLIEQNQELKKSMVELQKWSNDLKANTEKKLNKAFESVTLFRSSCLEQEAHAKKALSDHVKMKVELEKASASHRETASKLAMCEGDLHREQDSRSEIIGQLSAAKTSLQRLTTQRDTLLKDFEESKKEISGMKGKLMEMESTAVRFTELQKQYEALRSERQDLKARAYDDVARIRQLEHQLDVKEKELDELGNICDEAMGELEDMKLGRHKVK